MSIYIVNTEQYGVFKHVSIEASCSRKSLKMAKEKKNTAGLEVRLVTLMTRSASAVICIEAVFSKSGLDVCYIMHVTALRRP